MAQLFGETIRHHVDGLVKFVTVILGMNIRPRQSKVNLHYKSVFHRAFIVVPKGDVRTFDKDSGQNVPDLSIFWATYTYGWPGSASNTPRGLM